MQMRCRSANDACGDATPSNKPLEWTGHHKFTSGSRYSFACHSGAALGRMTSVPVTIDSPRRVRPLTLFALFAPLSVLGFALALVADSALKTLLFFVFVFGLFLSAAFLELQARKRTVLLDSQRRTVEVTDRLFLIFDRKRNYQADQFTSVISYLTPDRYPLNRLELLLSNGRDGLVLLSTPPVWHRAGFLHAPHKIEHPAVHQARDVVSLTLSLQNLGFAGYRKTGPQVRPNAA